MSHNIVPYNLFTLPPPAVADDCGQPHICCEVSPESVNSTMFMKFVDRFLSSLGPGQP